MSKKIDRLINIINSLEMKIYEPLYNHNYASTGHWDYCVYNFQDFLAHIEESHIILGKKKGLKFLDVGCGLGSKVSLAMLYFDSFGIELNEDYYQVAKEINIPRTFFKYGRYKNKEGSKERIFKKDALKFDYSPYDVIYFFRPLNKLNLQQNLEKQIFETMKPGSIVIPIFAQSKFPNFIRHLPTPSSEIYMKLKNDKKAENMIEQVKTLF